MADQAQNPPTPDAPAPVIHHELIEDDIETVRVRRAPKYSVFLILGGAIGLFVAMILTFAFSGTAEESPNTGMVYTQGQVFGFLALLCIPAGVALFGLLALLLDRTAARKARDVRVDHEHVHRAD